MSAFDQLTGQELKDMFEGLESAFGQFMPNVSEGLECIADAINNHTSLDNHTLEESANKIMNSNLEAAEALRGIAAHLTSPNECDSNMEPANVVDGLFAISRALNLVAQAISDRTA